MGSEFGNFGGFEWVRSSILVGEPGFVKGSKFGLRVRRTLTNPKDPEIALKINIFQKFSIYTSPNYISEFRTIHFLKNR